MLKPYRLYYQSSDRQIIQVTNCAQYDSGLFYLLKPGTCSFVNREFNVANSINSAGVRDDEASLTEPSIVVLGDSYSMGWGVEQSKAFPQLLEKLTGKKVLNAGVSSYGTARATKLYSRLNPHTARHIIFQYHTNDFEENDSFIKHNFNLPIRSQRAYDSLRHNIMERQRYFPFKHLYGMSKSFATQMIRSEPPPIAESRAAAKFLNVLEHAGLKKEGIQIIVFKVDDYDKLTDDFVNAIDSLIKEDAGWNLKTVKLSKVLTESDYFILDDHINARGHAKIAAKLYESLDTVSPQTEGIAIDN